MAVSSPSRPWASCSVAYFVPSDFLLFVPAKQNTSPLEAALSYYSSIVTLNAEGDSMVTEETLEGLGTTGFLLHTLFGSILRLAQPTPPEQSPYLNPPGYSHSHTPGSPTTPELSTQPSTAQGSDMPTRQRQSTAPLKAKQSSEDGVLAKNAAGGISATSRNTTYSSSTANTALPASSLSQAIQQVTGEASRVIGLVVTTGDPNEQEDRGGIFLDEHDHPTQLEIHEIDVEDCDDELSETRLTRYLPEPGYFIAGALAGGISRTATAPFDRLKVYLLVKTDNGAGLKINAAKKGNVLGALGNVGKPIGDAVRTLWKAGGFRTFFAGM